MLVCIEGVDGVGKSTIASEVRKAFTLNNVILCSDPCREHPATLAIRQFLLARGKTLPVATQIQLFEAARAILMHDFIMPALHSGALVICDRFWLSTIVYQEATELNKYPIDILFYLSDSKDNIKSRISKFNIVSDFSTIDDIALDELNSRYRKAIADNSEHISRVVDVDASSISNAVEHIVQVISDVLPHMTIYNKDFGVSRANRPKQI